MCCSAKRRARRRSGGWGAGRGRRIRSSRRSASATRSTRCSGTSASSCGTNPAPDPTFVLFFSDGGIYQDAKIEKHLIGSQEEPIFWQFIGLGTEEDYGVLERFDTLPGRSIDNVGFFSIDDIEQIDDAELYNRILSEFPEWLRAARTAKLI